MMGHDRTNVQSAGAPIDTTAHQHSAAAAAIAAAATAAANSAQHDMDLSSFRDPKLARELIDRIHRLVGNRRINLMEVCGTHTVSIGRYGFRSIMPEGLRLLSGPGCPVCVTANRDIDHAIALARTEGITVATFGDMMRVPGSTSSLAAEKSAGRDVRIVYSPLDALELATELPDRNVVFMGVGFETTTPAIAACVLEAASRGIENFSVFCVHKTTPPALRAIANDPETTIDGFILPGHVCTITGLAPFQFIAREFNIPSVVTGFEPVDILTGIDRLVEMIISGTPAVENAYPRSVRDAGNPVARSIAEKVFEPCSATWRGLGEIALSGLRIREDYARYDARRRFAVEVEPTREPHGCRCGDVLRGVIAPTQCPLFGRACTPEHPVGPCMVSSEGSCAAYFRYR